MKNKYNLPLSEDNADAIIKNEIGEICLEVLDCASVFKDTEDGRRGALKFMQSIGFSII